MNDLLTGGLRPVSVSVAAIGPRRPQMCHFNAASLALGEPERYTWMIGLAGYDDEWTDHSWVVDSDGRHLEVTWPVPGDWYRGVPVRLVSS